MALEGSSVIWTTDTQYYDCFNTCGQFGPHYGAVLSFLSHQSYVTGRWMEYVLYYFPLTLRASSIYASLRVHLSLHFTPWAEGAAHVHVNCYA